ncbi:MAG: hypothetical protein JO155_14975 [Acidimicrobiia bacterium]|nr:hypothetical protein [Acidimicrobiia bacterium]
MRALRAFTVVVLGLGLIAAACGSGGSSETPAQAKAKITTAWQTFFDPSVPVAQKPDLIENGSQMQATLQTQSTNPLAKSIKAQVTDVTLEGNSAVVTYNILSTQTNQTLLPPGSKGQAVKQNGKWKVSQATFCGLIHAGDANAKCP